MAAKPGGFGYYRNGEPYRFLAKGSTGGLGYSRNGRPFRGLIVNAGTTYTVTASGGLQAGGSATVFKSFVTAASGGIQLSGVAPNSVTIVGAGGWPIVGGTARSPLIRQGGPAMGYLGDFGVGQLITDDFPTTKNDGTPTALTGGALTVYRDGGTTKSTAGVTLTASLDSLTGLNAFTVDTTADAAFYAPGHDYKVILTAGTVNGLSVVSTVVSSFSIRNRPSPVMSAPFSTAGIRGVGG